jgi:hypothetical protein
MSAAVDDLDGNIGLTLRQSDCEAGRGEEGECKEAREDGHGQGEGDEERKGLQTARSANAIPISPSCTS